MKPPRLWPRMDERCSYTAVILALSVVNVQLEETVHGVVGRPHYPAGA